MIVLASGNADDLKEAMAFRASGATIVWPKPYPHPRAIAKDVVDGLRAVEKAAEKRLAEAEILAGPLSAAGAWAYPLAVPLKADTAKAKAAKAKTVAAKAAAKGRRFPAAAADLEAGEGDSGRRRSSSRWNRRRGGVGACARLRGACAECMSFSGGDPMMPWVPLRHYTVVRHRAAAKRDVFAVRCVVVLDTLVTLVEWTGIDGAKAMHSPMVNIGGRPFNQGVAVGFAVVHVVLWWQPRQWPAALSVHLVLLTMLYTSSLWVLVFGHCDETNPTAFQNRSVEMAACHSYHHGLPHHLILGYFSLCYAACSFFGIIPFATLRWLVCARVHRVCFPRCHPVTLAMLPFFRAVSVVDLPEVPCVFFLSDVAARDARSVNDVFLHPQHKVLRRPNSLCALCCASILLDLRGSGEEEVRE